MRQRKVLHKVIYKIPQDKRDVSNPGRRSSPSSSNKETVKEMHCNKIKFIHISFRVTYSKVSFAYELER